MDARRDPPDALRAAGEEYGLRGLVFRVAGGWTRGARAGLVLGVVVSTVLFATVHVATDAWLNLWYLVFGIGTALITWRTGGSRSPWCSLAMFNTFSFVFDAALRMDIATVVTDRSAGAETAMVLVPSAIVIATLGVVWIRTQRSGPARTPSPDRIERQQSPQLTTDRSSAP